MVFLEQPIRRWIVAMLLLVVNGLLPSWAETLPDSQNQLTEQQRQELESMVEASKKQAAHLPPNLETQKQLSEGETKQLEKLVEQSEQAITPILQQEVKALLESEQYKANQSAGERLAREVLQLPQQSANHQPTQEKETSTGAETEGQVLVFVSSSMPIETLRNYARSLVKVKGALVLRGGIDGLRKIGPTIAFSQRVLKVDPYCRGNCPLFNIPLLIDPLLFRQHHITQVPAIAFQVEGVIQGCERSNTAPATEVIFGDISLKGALDRLQQLKPHPKLNNLITILENFS
jgi:type-F conjugative transfer system pilin assembly protein TrbC